LAEAVPVGHISVMDPASELERRASAGDADAQFTLGARLLASPDSPDAFARGAALVERAAASGHAEATCMQATLEAIGAGRRQDWNRALDCLELAAGRGSERARAQLRLLAGTAGSPAEAEGDLAAGTWRGLRNRIDVGRLLQVPGRIAVSEAPRMRVFEGFASPAECRWVIATLRPKLGPAMVWDDATGLGKVDPSRSNSAVELRLPEMDVVIELLRARISVATRLPEAIFEVPQVMHYSVGQEFRPHHDFLDPQQQGPAGDIARRGQRIGSFLIYLNEDFEGGETEFPKAAFSYRGRAGDALFFTNVTRDGRPDPLTLHAGRPPTKGEKWIFSQWIRDRAPG
jgi:prolyl 4-hydroxylase